MFGEFLNIIFKSIKLDKTLYSDNKNFGEASIYFAGIIMILDGIAGAVAANTIIKTAVAMSGLTAILTWFVWATLIFVIGVKLFPDKQTKVPFKKVLTAVGYAHAPGLLRFFAITPDLMVPIIFLTQFWIFAALIISTTIASTGVPGVSEYLAGKCTLYLVPTLPFGNPLAFNVPSNGTQPIAMF